MNNSQTCFPKHFLVYVYISWLDHIVCALLMCVQSFYDHENLPKCLPQSFMRQPNCFI